MAEIADVQRDLVKSMHEQHWLHARHVENERLLIVNVFALILAGSVAAYKDEFFEKSAMPVHAMLMVLAVFCALFSIKIDAIFKGHTQKADSLLQAYGLPAMLDQLVTRHWVNRYIRISRFFLYFFALSFCFLLGIVAGQYECLSAHSLHFYIPTILFVLLVFGLDRLSYDATTQTYKTGSFPEGGT